MTGLNIKHLRGRDSVSLTAPTPIQHIYDPNVTEQSIYGLYPSFGQIYSIGGDTMKAGDGIYSNGENTASYFDVDFGTSYYVEARIDVGSGGCAIGLGNTGTDDGYWLYLQDSSTGAIKRRPDWADMATFNPNGIIGTWKIQINGTTLTAYKDGNLIATATIPALSTSGGSIYEANDTVFHALTISLLQS